MDFKKIHKFFKRISVYVVIIGLLCTISACNTPDSKVNGEYHNPYTRAEVDRMLRYHGALVARFDGKQWYFLSGHRWIKIENGGAKRFALAETVSGSSPSL